MSSIIQELREIEQNISKNIQKLLTILKQSPLHVEYFSDKKGEVFRALTEELTEKYRYYEVYMAVTVIRKIMFNTLKEMAKDKDEFFKMFLTSLIADFDFIRALLLAFTHEVHDRVIKGKFENDEVFIELLKLKRIFEAYEEIIFKLEKVFIEVLNVEKGESK